MIGYIITFISAIILGKLVSKMKLPAILGWLIAGMILGPYALGLLNQELLDNQIYKYIINILECIVGLMIGTELVWKKIKSAGKQIIITTLTQSLGTFFLVSFAFGVLFFFLDIPFYLGFIFGGIALATAPAPALSIVKEFKTQGPVTKTLIPMAVLDDVIGVIIFFSVISIVGGHISNGGMPFYMIPLFIILPIIIGGIGGLICGFILKKTTTLTSYIINIGVSLLVISFLSIYINEYLLPVSILNFMLIGMAFSAVFANMLDEEKMQNIMRYFNPVISICLVAVILNLGAPLDYHLILGAGVFTALYIIFRALGKYFGAYFGASITNAPQTVKKYLGFTLLPHSGVSLVFTGIAVNVLSPIVPEYANIIQGTIAAAAVINEIIAVIIAKKGFEWAGELQNMENNN